MPYGDNNCENAEDENQCADSAPKLRATFNTGTVSKTKYRAYIENTHSLQEPKRAEKYCNYSKYYLSYFFHFYGGLSPRFVFGRHHIMIALTGNTKIKNVTNGS